MPQTATIEPNINMMNIHHIINQSIIEPEPASRNATAEEILLFKKAEEEFYRGEYYEKQEGETMQQFLDRINADPENQLVCNLTK